MKYEIKKIDWLSVGIFNGLFLGSIFLIPMTIGFIASIGRIFNGRFNMEILGFLLFPVGAMVAGFIVGILFAFLYNFIAVRWSGIKMDIEYIEEKNK